jgi:hypothetical protein
MVPHSTRLSLSDSCVDRWLIQAVVQLSSSAAAREVAAAWVATYDTARASGSGEDEACARADHAYRVAARRIGLAVGRQDEERRAA